MKIYAPAKVNLGLDVVRAMENGYHELDMIMAPISLYDELDIEYADQDKIEIENMELSEDNTISKTLGLLRDCYDIKHHYLIRVKKNIPSQAGLAGGSADAAAVLKTVLELEGIEVEMEEKLNLAKQIGADVPFCLVNQFSRVKGIGEKIEILDANWKFNILLVKPDFGVSTPEAFRLWENQEKFHPDIDYVQMACENQILDLLVQAIGNALEPVAFELRPELAKIKEEMLDLGMVRVMMSGSGSSMMGFCIDEDVLQKAKSVLEKRYGFVEVVSVGAKL